MTLATAAPFPLKRKSSTMSGNASIPSPDVSPLGTPSYSATPVTARLDVAIGGNYCRLRRTSSRPPERRDWKRGTVQTFSARSRSRMLQALAQSDLRGYEQRAHFLTFTYHDTWGGTGRNWKRDLDKIDKRLYRQYPDAWWIWKLEFQQRGAPHFHCLMFGPRNVRQNWVRTQWQEVIGTSGYYAWRYGAEVDGLKSWKQVGHYCSKYCAKVDESIQPGPPGRFWGIKRRENRTVNLQSVEVTDEEFKLVRRQLRRLIEAANGHLHDRSSHAGIWCRLSNDTIKKLLTWAISSLDASTERWKPPPAGVHAVACDTPVPGSEQYSRYDWLSARQTRIGRSARSASTPLWDWRDAQARWAKRFFA